MPVVYILTNPAMPGLVKIGCTDRTIEDRLRELTASAGVPLPFECFLAVEVSDPWPLEKAFHQAFGDRRINARREFFEIAPDRPAAILKLFQDQSATAKNVTPTEDVVSSPEEQVALDNERRRRSNFRFSLVGIKPGDQLQSVFDDAITCIVKNDRWVEFRGEEHSLSSSALIIAHEQGRGWPAIAGPAYWKHDGKTLAELRDQVAEEE
jgi:hypothetical protein